MNLEFIEDPLKLLLVPASLYYRHKIAKESGRNEPELGILHDIVRAGCTAIDVGANRGYYSYALSKIAGTVEAFEPNPAMARFARRKLGRAAHVHEVALTNKSDMLTLYIPQKGSSSLHLSASLKRPDDYERCAEQTVRAAKLDDFAFDDVGFIKMDAEGSEMEIIEGAGRTISRDRPNLVVELIGGMHADPHACIEKIVRVYGYRAWIMVGDRLVEAAAALRAPNQGIKTRNVLFKPAGAG